MLRPLRRLWLPAAALLLLSGCGGSTKTVTVGGPPAAGTPVSDERTGSQQAPTGPVVHETSFRSPTGNIGCQLAGGQLRCDIERREWAPPPRPRSCPKVVDYGQGIELQDRGPSRFVCAGDTVRDLSAPVLPYGSTSMTAGFECISATSGMTCTRADGHGFFLSIQTYRIF